MEEYNTGAYIIVNLTNYKAYVGGVYTGFEGRWNRHRYTLRRNVHPNAHLQAAWNRDGEGAFMFFVLERCAPADVQAVEQKWLDQLQTVDRARGYNFMHRAGGDLRPTPEARQKLREARAKQVYSPETCAKISASQRARLAKKKLPEGERWQRILGKEKADVLLAMYNTGLVTTYELAQAFLLSVPTVQRFVRFHRGDEYGPTRRACPYCGIVLSVVSNCFYTHTKVCVKEKGVPTLCR